MINHTTFTFFSESKGKLGSMTPSRFLTDSRDTCSYTSLTASVIDNYVLPGAPTPRPQQHENNVNNRPPFVSNRNLNRSQQQQQQPEIKVDPVQRNIEDDNKARHYFSQFTPLTMSLQQALFLSNFCVRFQFLNFYPRLEKCYETNTNITSSCDFKRAL